MMTMEYHQEHQRQMWSAKTVEERQKIRDAHRKQLIERAKQQITSSISVRMTPIRCRRCRSTPGRGRSP
jgi:hypothetical protein